MVQPYQHIMIATDFSEYADRAVDLGVELVQRFGARVTLLHAYDASAFERAVAPLSIGREELERQMAETARVELERLASAKLADAEGIDCMPVPADSPALAVVDHAKDHGVDLIVLGTHGRSGFKRLWSGSVAERVVRHASCDVLVVRAAPTAWPPKHVLAATDFSKASLPASKRAVQLGKGFGCRVSLAYVFDDTVPIGLPDGTFESKDHATKRLEADTAAAAAKLDPPPAPVVLHGTSPAHALCDYAGNDDADLIVVGTHGRTGMAQLLIGSVAERIVRYAPAAALIVRSQHGS